MAKLSPLGNNAQLINGIPANGAKLFFYSAGSSTKQTTFTDEAGLTPQSNPIILDSRGEPSQPIWLTEGLSYKVVFASSVDTDPPSSPIWDVDNVTGINDSSVTLDQWIVSGITPTYVNATQFTLPGDQTSAFEVGRRIIASVTAGTVYGTIIVSAFTSLTTVTLLMDAGQILDNGLSSVSYGLLTNSNNSIPAIAKAPFTDATALVKGSADATKLLRFEVDGLTSSTTRIATMPDKDITLIGVEDVRGGANLGSKIQPISATVASNALTLTLNPTVLDFRSSTLGNGTVTTTPITAAISTLISSGSTAGTVSAIQNTIIVAAIYNGGTPELAWINLASGAQLDETNLISTTAEGGSGGADSVSVWYSTTARSSQPYRIVGYVTSTQATAGTWATAPSLIQGVGGNVRVNSRAEIVALVNFNATGTPAIRASGNVSSITDNGTGDFTINFTTALPDANYTFSGGCNNGSGAVVGYLTGPYQAAPTASAFRFATLSGGGANTDYIYTSLSIVR